MAQQSKIVLSVPGLNKSDMYFSLRIKANLNVESPEYEQPSKIIALSDIEGNFHALKRILIKNNVIDKNYQWTFENGHLVITGDCFDRGKQVTECLWLIYSLEERARREGGHVHFILGNHEIMNLNGDWRYVHPKYAKSTKTPYTAIYNGNTELWNWLCTKNIIEKIGSNLFVHGGIANELLQLGFSISEINDLVRPYYKAAHNQFEDPLLHIIFNTEKSPFWFRGYYQNKVSEKQINDTLIHFGVNTIITGHTPVNRITTFFNGKVINIDTNHADEKSEALLIKEGNFYRLSINGKRERIK